MCNHLSGKELLTGKGKSEEGERREKGDKKQWLHSYFFLWLLEGWFYLPPPPKKKNCSKKEVYLAVTFSNIRLEIYYVDRSYRNFFFAFL